jgi:coenzyme F420-reducing hydrogenase beta subunit
LAQKHDKGHFEFYAASSAEELRASAGSIYQPTDISNILREITKDKTQRWAVVGVPCLCAGIRNLKHLREQIPYVFGLACGMYQNTYYTELLLKRSGIDRHNVLQIDYRLEAESGNASNYQFRGRSPARSGRRIPYHALPYFLGKHAYFRLNACNFCRDVFAETADACFMDAWLPEYSNDRRGTSLVVIRNQAIDAMFSSRSANLEIAWEPIVAEKTVQSQLGHVRRKRETIAARVGQTDRAGNCHISSCSTEAIRWRLQKHTQQRSKHAWSRWGREYGSGAFWIAMIDLVVLQKTCDTISRTTRLAKTLYHKVRSTTWKPSDVQE